jgi:hypothetical protein
MVMIKNILEYVVHVDGEIGCEIEMEGRALQLPAAAMRGKWRQTEDGSLRGEGIEYVLPLPVSRATLARRLQQLKQNWDKYGASPQPSDRCGVHIHINCQSMTREEMFKFVTLYLVMEEILLAWCGPSRQGNLFCLSANDAPYLVQSLAADRHMGIIPRDDGDTRYAALNTESLRKYGSLEFRAMQTPDDIMRILLWVDALLAIRDFSQTVEYHRELVEMGSRLGWESYAKRILGDALYQEFCPNPNVVARRMLKGVRMAQIVAFADRR